MGFSCKFNGSTSKVDTQSTFGGLTGAITILAWIKPYSFGEVDGRILGNGGSAVNFLLKTSDSNVFLRRGGAGSAVSANNSIILNKHTFVVATSTSAGVTNFYMGDKDTAPVLSGSVDQDAGTPESGSTNVIIGNIDDQSRTFDGTINKLSVVEGILTLAQITQYWSSSRKEI